MDMEPERHTPQRPLTTMTDPLREYLRSLPRLTPPPELERRIRARMQDATRLDTILRKLRVPRRERPALQTALDCILHDMECLQHPEGHDMICRQQDPCIYNQDGRCTYGRHKYLTIVDIYLQEKQKESA